MNTTSNTVKKSIMRRVYYTYALSVCCNYIALSGVVFAVSLHSFAQLVHVAKVWENFLSVPVGSAPGHILRVFSHGDFFTLLSLVLASASLLVVLWHLPWRSLSRHTTSQMA